MFVPIKMDIGELAIAVLPGVKKVHNMEHIKAVKGKITDIKKINDEYSVSMIYKDELNTLWGTSSGTGQWKKLKIMEYRIVKFTFGGVWQPNDEFDLNRIENEENVKIDPTVFDGI
jgi:hypothetical protein